MGQNSSADWATHHFFASTAVIANHKTSSSPASSIYPSIPGPSTQNLISSNVAYSPTLTHLIIPLPISTTPTLTATLPPSGTLEIGPELLLTPLETPTFDSSQRS